jgi:hypothetical protein
MDYKKEIILKLLKLMIDKNGTGLSTKDCKITMIAQNLAGLAILKPKSMNRFATNILKYKKIPNYVSW